MSEIRRKRKYAHSNLNTVLSNQIWLLTCQRELITISQL